jgi:hypothetical protein
MDWMAIEKKWPDDVEAELSFGPWAIKGNRGLPHGPRGSKTACDDCQTGTSFTEPPANLV